MVSGEPESTRNCLKAEEIDPESQATPCVTPVELTPQASVQPSVQPIGATLPSVGQSIGILLPLMLAVATLCLFVIIQNIRKK